MNYLELSRNFSVLTRRFQAIIAAACEKMELSYSEYVIIMKLYSEEGKSQDDLASILLVDKAVVTRTVSLLEKKGWVRREKDRRDKRINHLYLTDFARERQSYLTAINEQWTALLAQKIKENEREILTKSLKIAADQSLKINARNFVEKLKYEN